MYCFVRLFNFEYRVCMFGCLEHRGEIKSPRIFLKVINLYEVEFEV